MSTPLRPRSDIHSWNRATGRTARTRAERLSCVAARLPTHWLARSRRRSRGRRRPPHRTHATLPGRSFRRRCDRHDRIGLAEHPERARGWARPTTRSPTMWRRGRHECRWPSHRSSRQWKYSHSTASSASRPLSRRARHRRFPHREDAGRSRSPFPPDSSRSSQCGPRTTRCRWARSHRWAGRASASRPPANRAHAPASTQRYRLRLPPSGRR